MNTVVIWLIPLLVLSEFCVCLTHCWARYDWDYWANRPWIPGWKRTNWFHVASFMSHFPVAIALLYLSGLRWPYWILAALLCELAWFAGKRIAHKNWSFWWQGK